MKSMKVEVIPVIQMVQFIPVFVVLVLLSSNINFSYSLLRKPLMKWTNNANTFSGDFNSRVYSVGDPLFLTPYIENGKIDEAKKLAKVGPLPNAPQDQLPSYAGLLTVNKTHRSNLFFWFFLAMVSA